MRGFLEPPLSTGAGGGSPVYLAWHGGLIIQAPVWGPDAAKSRTDNCFGMVLDLASVGAARIRPSRAFFALRSRH